MKKITFLLLFFADTLLALSQVVVSDFESGWNPNNNRMTGWSMVSNDFWDQYSGTKGIVKDPDNTNNKVALVKVSYVNPPNGGFAINSIDESLYPANTFYAISMKIKCTDYNGFRFTYSLEQGSAFKGNYNSYPAYTGNGNWQTVTFPFTADQKTVTFKRIGFNPTYAASDTALPSEGFNFYIDDITLLSITTDISSDKIDNEANIVYHDGLLAIGNIDEKTTVRIYTATGSLVHESAQTSDFSVNLREQGLSSGILIIKLHDGEKQSSHKIIL